MWEYPHHYMVQVTEKLDQRTGCYSIWITKFIWLGVGPGPGCPKHTNEPSDSINVENFLNQLGERQLLKKDSAP